MSPRRTEALRCIAPLGEVPEDSLEGVRLCGKLATTTRVADGIECPLCAAHAAEIDRDRESGEE